MTAQSYSVTGASPDCDYLWRQVNWQQVESPVRRLKMRIAKVVQQGNRLYWVVKMALERLELCAGTRQTCMHGS
jgi:hypothetical protein